MIALSPLSGLPAHDTPGTFAALMDLYERNYINLRRLLPVVPPAPAIRVSRVPGGLDLHLRVTERCRYTSELILTYEFNQDDGGATIVEPDLRIRVYHDARLVEVMAARPRHRPVFAADFLIDKHPERAQLYARWQINRFLYKWFVYCLRQGHRFLESPPAPCHRSGISRPSGHYSLD